MLGGCWGGVGGVLGGCWGQHPPTTRPTPTQHPPNVAHPPTAVGYPPTVVVTGAASRLLRVCCVMSFAVAALIRGIARVPSPFLSPQANGVPCAHDP